MSKWKPLRTCPICRTAMLRSDTGWHCPQCGSVIVDAPVKGEPRNPARETAPAADELRGLNTTA